MMGPFGKFFTNGRCGPGLPDGKTWGSGSACPCARGATTAGSGADCGFGTGMLLAGVDRRWACRRFVFLLIGKRSLRLPDDLVQHSHAFDAVPHEIDFLCGELLLALFTLQPLRPRPLRSAYPSRPVPVHGPTGRAPSGPHLGPGQPEMAAPQTREP